MHQPVSEHTLQYENTTIAQNISTQLNGMSDEASSHEPTHPLLSMAFPQLFCNLDQNIADAALKSTQSLQNLLHSGENAILAFPMHR